MRRLARGDVGNIHYPATPNSPTWGGRRACTTATRTQRALHAHRTCSRRGARRDDHVRSNPGSARLHYKSSMELANASPPIRVRSLSALGGDQARPTMLREASGGLLALRNLRLCARLVHRHRTDAGSRPCSRACLRDRDLIDAAYRRPRTAHHRLPNRWSALFAPNAHERRLFTTAMKAHAAKG